MFYVVFLQENRLKSSKFDDFYEKFPIFSVTERKYGFGYASKAQKYALRYN